MATVPGEERNSITGGDNFHDASEEVAYDTSESDIHETAYLDPEHRAKLEEEWRQELAITEEDITSLRTVLAEKVKRAQDLKRKLGITVWREFKDDMEQGIKNVKESHAYHKTGVALKTAGEKTTGAFTTLGTTVSKKIGDVKNSTTFKSFEERVGSAYENVKSKVSTSRSSSTHSFEEALNDTSSTGPSPKTTTPTIVEEKPIS